MADLSITAASVLKGTGAVTSNGTAGATITAGQTLYIDTSDSNKLKLFDANASATTSVLAGVALHGASSGQPISYQTAGPITIGATVALGTIYIGSATAGGIAPSSDLASGWYTNILGVATSTSVITININASAALVP
jgi:hypothetical protein